MDAALSLLWQHPGSSVGALARDLGLSPSATVRVIDRLENSGWVLRQARGAGRVLNVWLTSEGQERAGTVARRRDEILELAGSALSQAESATFADLLFKVAQVLLPDSDTADIACRLCDQRRCMSAGCPLPTDARTLPSVEGGYDGVS